MAFDKEELELLHNSILCSKNRLSHVATDTKFYTSKEKEVARSKILLLDKLINKICKEKYEPKNS